MKNIRKHLIIEGLVQGVWFRESTRREALSLAVTGWVRNRPDGTVEVVAEGQEKEIGTLISWCRRGPRSAKVTRVIEKDEPWQGEFVSFEVVF